MGGFILLLISYNPCLYRCLCCFRWLVSANHLSESLQKPHENENGEMDGWMDGWMRDASITGNEHRKLGLGWTAGADSIINCSERKACFFSSHGIREQDTRAANLTIEICPHRIANSPWLAFKCSWLNYNSIQCLIHTCGLHIILQTEHCTASLSKTLPSF